MRSLATLARLVALGAAGLLLVPPAAAETDIDEQLRLLQERLTQMEDQLESTNEKLTKAESRVDEQQQVMEDAGIDKKNGVRSALSSFLETTDFAGWVAASYTYNVSNNSNNGIVDQNSHFFYPDSNTFALDQAWFEMDRPVSEDSRAGFHMDVFWGKHADVLNGNTNSTNFGGDSPELFTAYVSWLAPVLNGIRIDGGKMATLLGAEVVQTNANFNITRGLVWGLQPVNYVGITASTEIVDNVSLTLGFANDVYTDTNTDGDNNKAFTGQVAYSGEKYGGALGIMYGNDLTVANQTVVGGSGGCCDNAKTGILDVLLTADPTDKLSLWYNFDWVWSQDHGPSPGFQKFGNAVAARYQLMEKLGLALRGEVVQNQNRNGVKDLRQWSITTTVDYALTDSLQLKAEARYDDANNNNQFNSSRTPVLDPGGSRIPTLNEQWTLLAQAIYTF